jgi:hypothetical protein
MSPLRPAATMAGHPSLRAEGSMAAGINGDQAGGLERQFGALRASSCTVLCLPDGE